MILLNTTQKLLIVLHGNSMQANLSFKSDMQPIKQAATYNTAITHIMSCLQPLLYITACIKVIFLDKFGSYMLMAVVFNI